jgi:hypothetical protein
MVATYFNSNTSRTSTTYYTVEDVYHNTTGGRHYETTGTLPDWLFFKPVKPPKSWRWFDCFRRHDTEKPQIDNTDRAALPTKRTLHLSCVERRRWKRRRWLAALRGI